MSSSASEAITRVLRDATLGGGEAVERLVPLVYDELRALAERALAGERAGHTLQPTALVHEAFMKLVGEHDRQWQNRTHFFCAAATAMRRILINHAHARNAAKRGGGAQRVPLDDTLAMFEERTGDIVSFDRALERLAAESEQARRVVELRFFVGLDLDQVADVLSVSTRTVERQWRLARAWLRRDLAAG